MVAFVPEKIWIDKGRYQEAEIRFFELGKGKKSGDGSGLTKQSSKETINQHHENPIISEINKVRHFIQNSLNSGGVASDSKSGQVDDSVLQRLSSLESENKELRKVVEDLLKRVASLEVQCKTCTPAQSKAASAPVKPAKKVEIVVDDDDDLDLFGDDDGTAAPKKPAPVPVKVEKKKKEVIAKSSVVLEVKPWDDETDLKEMERLVRTIVKDGLLWGTSKLVPVAYNVKKLQIVCVVEDEKVSIEELQEEIEAFEDYVQSVDVAAFNKI